MTTNIKQTLTSPIMEVGCFRCLPKGIVLLNGEVIDRALFAIAGKHGIVVVSNVREVCKSDDHNSKHVRYTLISGDVIVISEPKQSMENAK